MIFDEEMENEDEDRKEKDVIEDFFLVSTLLILFIVSSLCIMHVCIARMFYITCRSN